MKTVQLKFFRSLLVLVSLLGALSGVYTAKVLLASNSAIMVQAEEAVKLVQADPRDSLIESAGELGQKVDKDNIRDIRYIIAGIIRVVLTFVGTILTILIMYAGYLWWSARGNDEQVKKAKATLLNSVIGIIVIMMSYGLVNFLFRNL